MCALDIFTMPSSQCTKNQVSAASDQVCHPGQINIDAMTHWERVNRTNALLWPMLVRTPSLAYTIELNTRLGGTNVQISIRVWRPQQGGQYHMKIPFWHPVMIHLSCQSETMKQESKVWITCWVILPMMQNRFYGSPVGNDCIWLVIIVKQIHEIFAEMFGSDVENIHSCQQHPEQWEGTRRVLHLGSSACLIQPICPLDKLSWQPGCQVLNINIQGRNFCISQGNGSSTNLPENLV